MAFWLLACKEINGKIYVSRLSHTIGNPPIPGIPSVWFYVGPGNRPSVFEYSGNQFVLVFEYLSHMTVRVLDISTWPPTEVEPISPTTPINIGGSGTQAPIEQLFLRLSSTTGKGVGQFWLPGPQIVSTPIFYTPSLNQYSVTLTLAPGWVSGVSPAFYRVYRQPLLGGAWTMVQDWVPSPLNFTDTVTGSLQFNYRATMGYDYNPDFPNDTTKHFEGDHGNTISHDSTVEPLAFVIIANDPVDFSLAPAQMQATGIFGTRQQNIVEAVSDVIDWKFTPATGAATSQWDATRKSTVVFTTTYPTYTAPFDVIDFKYSGSQGQATLATGPRQDQ